MLLTVWEFQQILWIDAVTFLVALVPSPIIAIPSVRSACDRVQTAQSFKAESVAGLGFSRHARGLLSLLITATMLNFLLTLLSTRLPCYIRVAHFGEAADLAFVAARACALVVSLSL